VIGLLDREFIFVTGKGGVGKTTVAAAIGVAAAARGRRTVVCEVASQQRLPRIFGVAPRAGEDEVELRPRLAATSIEPDAILRHWLEGQLRSRALVAFLSRAPIFQYFVAAVPGAREVIALAQAWNLAQPQRWRTTEPGYDTVVVDGPSSGHAIGMLRTPRTFADIARVGTIRRQADRVRALLTDPSRTAYVAVATPEEMPVTEALELERRLPGEGGLAPAAAVVNAVSPHRFSAADVERLTAAEDLREASPAQGAGAIEAALAVARAQGRRSRAEQAQLARLRRRTEARVITLPRLLDGELAGPQIDQLAQELERRLGERAAPGERSPHARGAAARRSPRLA
jgi:anion-transporting  ArsA/GET3 family ATPase